jgi:hypothetical protein
VNQPAGGVAPPDVIYIIRHGEKPADPPAADPPAAGPGQAQPAATAPFGIDYEGVQDEHSLLPQGWQRSGALTALFDPALGPPRAGLQIPGALLSPWYGDQDKTAAHRTYQTIQGVSGRLGIPIVSTFAEGQEPQLAASVVSTGSGVVLICWDHQHIPALASALPVVSGTAIPEQWPGDRFDVIWTFTLVPGSVPAQYAFGQVPQQLLPGDTDTTIPA